MKKTIIVTNVSGIDSIKFEAGLSIVKGAVADCNLISVGALGWLGVKLKEAAESADDIFIVTDGFVDFAKLDTIKSYANANNHAAYIDGVILPTSSTDEFYSIDANSFLIYIDRTKLSNIDAKDFDYGPSCVFEKIYAADTTFNDNVISNSGTSKDFTNISFLPGWILIKQIVEAGQTIYVNNSDLSASRIDLSSENLLGSLVCGKYVTDLGVSEQVFDQIKLALKASNSQLVSQWQDSIESNFKNSLTPLENIYCRATVSNLVLLKNYAITDDSRIVFFAETEEQFAKVKQVIEQWDGTNTSSLTLLNSDEQQSIEALVSNFDFAQWLALVKKIYKAWFLLSNFDMLNDIESQCYVNNVIVVDSDFNSLLVSMIKSLRLASTELLYVSGSGFYVEKLGKEVYQHRKYKRFRIIFRNTQTGQQQPLEYIIQPHFTAQKWARCLHMDYMLHPTVIAEKNYMLQQWEYDESNPNARSIPVLCQEMNRYVKVINEYFDGSSDRRVNYHITQYFDPATLDQQILNEIHHHFELLIGQVWSISEYYKLADSPTCFAIRQLNNLCHEMEYLRKPTLREALASSTERAPAWNAGIYFPFIPTLRYKFVECDYDHFTQVLDYGDLLLHYAQLGKTPMEAYAARDEEVFDDNITGLRYLSGEFDVVFRRDVYHHIQRAKLEKDNVGAFAWIRARGQDPESKFTGIGFIPVAKVDRSKFPGMRADQIQMELFKYDDIYQLELLDDQGNIIEKLTLDYTWKDVLKKTDPTHPEFDNSMVWEA